MYSNSLSEESDSCFCGIIFALMEECYILKFSLQTVKYNKIEKY